MTTAAPLPLRARAHLLSMLACLLAGSVLAGCGEDKAAGAPSRYEMRGEIKDVGGEGADARATVHHEAVPTFKDRKGNIAPMKSMTMAFGIDPSVDRATLTKDAKVEMVVEVDWSREPALMIKQAKALPADTALEF